jgi:hypothetical protein
VLTVGQLLLVYPIDGHRQTSPPRPVRANNGNEAHSGRTANPFGKATYDPLRTCPTGRIMRLTEERGAACNWRRLGLSGFQSLTIAKFRGRHETPRIHLASWDLRDMGARSSSATAASDDYDRWEHAGGIWSLGCRTC